MNRCVHSTAGLAFCYRYNKIVRSSDYPDDRDVEQFLNDLTKCNALPLNVRHRLTATLDSLLTTSFSRSVLCIVDVRMVLMPQAVPAFPIVQGV